MVYVFGRELYYICIQPESPEIKSGLFFRIQFCFTAIAIVVAFGKQENLVDYLLAKDTVSVCTLGLTGRETK